MLYTLLNLFEHELKHVESIISATFTSEHQTTVLNFYFDDFSLFAVFYATHILDTTFAGLLAAPLCFCTESIIDEGSCLT